MKRRFSIVTTAAMALALSACGLSPEERMDRAEAAFQDHRYSEARLDLGTLLQADGSDMQALELLARTQLMLGDGVGAEASLERLTDDARPADYQQLLAEAFLLQGEFESALAAGEGLGTAEGLRIAAQAHLALGGNEAALDAFQRGTRADGDRSRLYADYARFMHMTGDTVVAASLADMAREADPEGLEPLLASALIAQDNGALPEALGYFEQAHRLWPESRTALLGRIGALGDMGREDDARALIADAAQRMPGDADVAYLQARLAAEDADWNKVRSLLQGFESSPDPRPQLLYARALVELGLPEQALPRLTALVRRMPELADARRQLARTQLGLGEAGAAFETIGTLATSDTGTPADLALYAEAARQSNQIDRIGRALAEAPPEAQVLAQMSEADAHMQAGRWQQAIAVLEDMRSWSGDANVMLLEYLANARSQLDEGSQG